LSDSGRRESFSPALGAIVSASAAPYGYTVSLWSSGALLIHFRGTPNVGDVFLFAAGALAGFGLLGLFAHGSLKSNEALGSGPERVLAGILHWVSVGLAVGAVALLAQIPSWVAWPLGSFTATVLYLLLATAELAFVAIRSGGRD
jgi:hypothetical protein